MWRHSFAAIFALHRQGSPPGIGQPDYPIAEVRARFTLNARPPVPRQRGNAAEIAASTARPTHARFSVIHVWILLLCAFVSKAP
jgi:hypothetical protein